MEVVEELAVMLAVPLDEERQINADFVSIVLIEFVCEFITLFPGLFEDDAKFVVLHIDT